MTSRNVETRAVRLEARFRIGDLSRLSREEIVARIGEIDNGLIDRHGEHSTVASALAVIDTAVAQRLKDFHPAGELQP